MSSKWSYLAYSQECTIITKCKHPGLLRAAAGAALGVQAATVMRYLAYPLSVTAGGLLSKLRWESSQLGAAANIQLLQTRKQLHP